MPQWDIRLVLLPIFWVWMKEIKNLLSFFWLICFKLCSYHVALDQWPHRSISKTVSDVPGGVCKELYATFEIAKLRVNKQVFHFQMSNQWNTVNHFHALIEQSPIWGVLKFEFAVVANWPLTVLPATNTTTSEDTIDWKDPKYHRIVPELFLIVRSLPV